jgi:hypothetical protein
MKIFPVKNKECDKIPFEACHPVSQTLFGTFFDWLGQNEYYAKRPNTGTNREHFPDYQEIPLQ